MFGRLVCFAALASTLGFAAGELSNRRAPGFALPDSDYNHFYDPQDYRGKVLIVEVMATTCPHCMLTTTTLENVKKKYADKVQIISVVTNPDTAETVKKYIQTHSVTSPIVFDQGQMIISYFNAKPGQAHVDVPHIFLIDKMGMIRNDFSYDRDKGAFEGTALYPEIDKLLK